MAIAAGQGQMLVWVERMAQTLERRMSLLLTLLPRMMLVSPWVKQRRQRRRCQYLSLQRPGPLALLLLGLLPCHGTETDRKMGR